MILLFFIPRSLAPLHNAYMKQSKRQWIDVFLEYYSRGTYLFLDIF